MRSLGSGGGESEKEGRGGARRGWRLLTYADKERPRAERDEVILSICMLDGVGGDAEVYVGLGGREGGREGGRDGRRKAGRRAATLDIPGEITLRAMQPSVTPAPAISFHSLLTSPAPCSLASPQCSMRHTGHARQPRRSPRTYAAALPRPLPLPHHAIFP